MFASFTDAWLVSIHFVTQPKSLGLRNYFASLIASCLANDFVLRKRCFPIRHRTGQKKFFGFQTGDIVKAVVPKGKYKGTHIGRVMIRASGSFDIRTKSARFAHRRLAVSIRLRLLNPSRWSYGTADECRVLIRSIVG